MSSINEQAVTSDKDLQVEGQEGDIEKNVPAGEIQSAPEYINAHQSVGLAVIEQRHIIPTTGERKVTTKKEVNQRSAVDGYKPLIGRISTGHMSFGSFSAKESVSHASLRVYAQLITSARHRQLWQRCTASPIESGFP